MNAPSRTQADDNARVPRLLVKRRSLKCLEENFTRLEKLAVDGALTVTRWNWKMLGPYTLLYVIYRLENHPVDLRL
jgi:hypothetical protein